MPDMTKTFIDALGRLETSRDADTIALLFADHAQVSNPLVNYDDGGIGAAKSFWSHYRDAFDEIRSEFSSVTEKDGMSFLEWHSHGEIDGKPFDYDGVSVLESDGEKITAFRTYFDTRHIPNAHSPAAHSPAARPKDGEDTGRAQASGEARGTAKGAEAAPRERDESDMVNAQREAAEQRSRGYN
jgi:hypothetical protein